MKSHFEIQVPVLVQIYESLLEVAFFVSIVVHGLELFRFLRSLCLSKTFGFNYRICITCLSRNKNLVLFLIR